MEFEVDSRFNGRPIPQISSLIVNQVSVFCICKFSRTPLREYLPHQKFMIKDKDKDKEIKKPYLSSLIM